MSKNNAYAIQFELKLSPMSQLRARASLIWPSSMIRRDRSIACPRCGCTLPKPRVHFHDETKVGRYKEHLALMSRGHRPRSPIVKPTAVSLDVTCFLPVPESLEKWKRQTEWPMTTRPDASNLLKPIEDALTVAGFWDDDAVIVDVAAHKRYSLVGHPRTIVSIVELKPPTRVN